MSESLARLLLRQSEAGEPAVLWGRQAAPYVGREFERLLDRGVLIELPPAEEWDVCPACDCGIDARPIQTIKGGAVAVCPFDHRFDRKLEACELKSYRIITDVLVQEIATASAFSDQPSEILPGIWHLGERSTGRELFLVLAKSAALQSGLVAKLKILRPDSPVTVVTPALASAEQSAFLEAGVRIIALDECLSAGGGFAVDLPRWEPTEIVPPRLVIMNSIQRAILDGVEKQIPQQPFKLLTSLAKNAVKGGGFLGKTQIEAEFSGRAASDLVRELKKFLAAGSADPQNCRALIKNRKSPPGYSLALSHTEIDVRP